MTNSRYIVSIVLLLFLCIPAAAQVNDTHVIPIVGLTDGAGGTKWTSSVHVFNPQTYPLNISITYLPTHGEIGEEVLLELGPNQTAVTEDVLGDWFATSGTGSLLFATFRADNPTVEDSVVARSFLVRSRAYNTGGANGSYGQGVPSTWIGLLDDGISSIAEGVTNVGNAGFSGFRTNVGAVNLGDETIFLLVVVYDEDGAVVGNTLNQPLEFTVHPFAHEQQRLPISGQRLTLEFFLDDPSGEAVVFPYVSVVDNRSGDGTYIEPKLLATGDILYKGKPGAKDSARASDRFLDHERALRVRERSIHKGFVRIDPSLVD